AQRDVLQPPDRSLRDYPRRRSRSREGCSRALSMARPSAIARLEPSRHTPYVVAFRRTIMVRPKPDTTSLCRYTIAVWLLAIGCRAPARPPLRATPLPDLSRAAAPVQAQLRERYAALARVTANPQASPGELAGAFGAMGMLLMAAEYREAAEPCLLNAEGLA